MDDRSAPWRGEVRQFADLTADQIGLWRRLNAAHAELRSPFFSFEFACAVAEAGARSRVCLLYRDGELAGFFPFQFANGFTQLLRAGERIGGAMNDFCGVIIDRSRHGSLGSCDLLRCSGLASFEVDHLPESQAKLGLRAETVSYGARIAFQRGEVEQYWAHVKSSHPKGYDTLRNRERKIDREFGSVKFVFEHPQPDELLQVILSEKHKQYQRSGRDNSFAEPWKTRCLSRIARYRDGRCVLVVSSLHFDGDWAAYHFGFRAGDVLHYFVPVYNQRFSNLSPGLILLARMIREAAGHGIGEIDLGEGLSRYKEMFATEIYPVYRDVWYRSGMRGLAYRGYLSAAWRAQVWRRGHREVIGPATAKSTF